MEPRTDQNNQVENHSSESGKKQSETTVANTIPDVDTLPPLPKTKPSILSIVYIVVVIILTSIIAYLVFQNQNLKKQIKFDNHNNPPSTDTPTNVTNERVYSNSVAQYSISYPDGWTVTETNPSDVSSGVVTGETQVSNSKSTLTIVSSGGFGGGSCGGSDAYPGSLVFVQTQDQTIKICKNKAADLVSYKGSCGDCNVLKHNQTSYVFNIESASEDEETIIKILSTFKFIDGSTTDQTSTPTSPLVKNLNFSMPANWVATIDALSNFSVGYNPETHTPYPYDNRVDLNSKKCCTSIFVSLQDYDGGSRHEFIREQIRSTTLENIKTSQTEEVEYLVEGKSALIIYNVDASSTTTIGVIVISNSKAVWITSQSSNRDLIEKTLTSISVE